MDRGQYKTKNGALTEISWGWNTLFLLILGALALCIILPVILVVVISFSSNASITARGYTFFPSEWSLSAYEYLLKTGDQLVRSYIFTIVHTSLGTVSSLLVMTLYAYVIAQRFFAARRILTWLLFFTMLFGGGLVPSYILNVRYLHINNSIWVFILPSLMSAYSVIILRTFLKTAIPEALVESAKIDGAGHLLIYWKIVLPLFKAGIATIGLFSVVGRWNDWFTGMLYIENPSLVPLQTMLIRLQNNIDFMRNNSSLAMTPEGRILLRTLPTDSMRMAVTLVVILPMLFAYPFFQRYFITGLTIGGIKE
jgi:putative aldouronate transport system permease protein